MEITTEKYARKHFEVEAVQVTETNIDTVSSWCRGEVLLDGKNKFIKVPVARVLNERQSKAFVGDWVLYAGKGFKVYTDKAFLASFEKLDGETKDAAIQAGKGQTALPV